MHSPGTIYQAPIWRGTALLAVCAIFLVFFGPVFDHHFAERQFGHAHLSLSGGMGGHVHFYESPGGRSHDNSLLAPHQQGDTAPADGVVNLTSTDGMGVVFIDLGGPIFDDGPRAPGPQAAPMLFRLFDDAPALSGAFVAPPKRPPRI